MKQRTGFQQPTDLILTISLPYATILSFTAFGPTLRYLMNTEMMNLTSTIFLIFLVLSIIIKPGSIFKNETKNLFLPVSIIITFLLLIPFAYYPLWLKWVSVTILAIIEGRIASIWSRYFLKEVNSANRGKITGIFLFISYGFLYLSNLVFPAIPPEWLPALASLPLLGSIPFIKRLTSRKINLTQWKHEKKQHLPIGILVIFLFIYISAGFTYSEIFPHLAATSSRYRFWNVLPFVMAVPVIGILADKIERNTLITLGIGCLGLSFIIYLFPESLHKNFILEILLQTGWAFLDAAVWIIGADLAQKNRNSQYQMYAVASFLTGTIIGSVLYMILRELLHEHLLIVLSIAHIPLFISLILISALYNSKKPTAIETENSKMLLYKTLTPREKEIAALLYEQNSNKEISYLLNISHNTLKTHIRNIYKKTNSDGRNHFKMEMEPVFQKNKQKK